MNKLYAADQAEAIEKVATISKTKRPAYIRMVKQEDGRYLIMWEGEQECQEKTAYPSAI